jgi:hypothetical protein
MHITAKRITRFPPFYESDRKHIVTTGSALRLSYSKAAGPVLLRISQVQLQA